MNTKEMIAAAMFAALTAIFAQISIPLPFSPVPITLQVFAVCLAAAILGSKLGTLSQLLYVAIGAVGLPVFSAGSSGIQTIIGPRGGYIIGFVLGAFVIGKIVERKTPSSLSAIMAAMLAGVVVIYAAGMLQLSMVTGMNLKAAFLAGAAPFIGMDIIKVVLGSYVAYSVRSILIRQNLLTSR